MFLVAEGERNADIYRRMVTMYGDHCLAHTAVNKWCNSFREGRQMTLDLPRPGQANKVITNDSIASVNEMNHTIIHKYLGYSKLCVAWVLKHLTLDHQKQRMGFCLQHLIPYEKNTTFLDRIIAGDASWCHLYVLESKKMSMQWKHSSSPSPQKSKAMITAQKVMLSFLFNCRGPLLIEFLPQGRTINSAQ